MRILDLFCGAGGAAWGYHLAFPDAEIVGVDSEPQPHYPFTFMQADAMTFDLDGFDFIHASPPCQHYSITRHSHSKGHPDLLAATRQRLFANGAPWVIENVVGAPMPNAVTLCGASFGLTATDTDGAPLVLKRHRLFEANILLLRPRCECVKYRDLGFMVGGVYGGGPSNRSKSPWKGSTRRRGGYTPSARVRSDLMGIDWMTQAELCEAIPPAYTEFIGAQFAATLDVAA